MDLCIIFPAGNPFIPDYKDDVLLLHFKSELLELNEDTELLYFGYAPDNTADGSDDLITEGTFFRLIASSEILGVDLETPISEVIKSFKNLIETRSSVFGTVITEKGFITTETTIEFIFYHFDSSVD